MPAIEIVAGLRVLAIEAAAGQRLALACARCPATAEILDRDRGVREAAIRALAGEGSAVDALARIEAARARP